MPEQEGTVAHPEIDVLPAVHVPLAPCLGPRRVDREGPSEAVVVGDPVRKDLAGAFIKAA